MKVHDLTIGRHRMFYILLMIFFQIIYCKKSKQDGSSMSSQEIQPLDVVVSIIKIDDTPIGENQIQNIGQRVIVEGTISDQDVIVCVLVHPVTTDQWWVQNLPGPLEKINENTWNWRTMIYCGTETLGLNEEYEIVALAESRCSVCQAGKTIKSGDFPRRLPRSRVIRVRRGEI